MHLRRILIAGFALLLAIAACSTSDDGNPAPSTTAQPDTTAAATESESATTTTIEAATTTTAEPDATGDESSRENPVPAGETVRVGDWDMKVLSATPDATAAVLAENEFNDPPAAGRQFYIIEVAATYQGQASEAMAVGLTVSAVGDSAVAYLSFDDTCGVIPGELNQFGEVFPGGTQAGNLCWQVATDDLDSLVLIVDNAFSFDEDRAFMALPSEGVAFDAPQVEPIPPEAGEVGTRGNPIPVGETVRVADWDLAVVSVTPDATEAVMAENSFNDPPKEGHQFYVVEVSATYQGADSEAVTLGLVWSTVGESAVAYGFEDTCGVIPNELDQFSEVFPGGTQTGNLCWQVRSEDVDGLLLIMDAFTFEEDRAFLALQD